MKNATPFRFFVAALAASMIRSCSFCASVAVGRAAHDEVVESEALPSEEFVEEGREEDGCLLLLRFSCQAFSYSQHSDDRSASQCDLVMTHGQSLRQTHIGFRSPAASTQFLSS